MKVVTLEPSTLKYCVENLREKSEYYFRIYAENSVGLSEAATTDLIILDTHASKNLEEDCCFACEMFLGLENGYQKNQEGIM